MPFVFLCCGGDGIVGIWDWIRLDWIGLGGRRREDGDVRQAFSVGNKMSLEFGDAVVVLWRECVDDDVGTVLSSVD